MFTFHWDFHAFNFLYTPLLCIDEMCLLSFQTASVKIVLSLEVSISTGSHCGKGLLGSSEPCAAGVLTPPDCFGLACLAGV